MRPRFIALVGAALVLAGTAAIDWRLFVAALGVLAIGFAAVAAARDGAGCARNPNRPPPPGPATAARTRPAPKPSGHPSPWSPPEPTDRANDPLARRGQMPISGGRADEPVPGAEGPDEAPTARV